ncbi:MAG: alpha/beta hydrolase fold domain-containing protein [Alphaproteobacteria bacterium]|nr:alpha/beta hydrolase fold domain-containing protein [Alphaproteobacteria bacterium]
MTRVPGLDPALFDENAVDPETREINARIDAALAKAPPIEKVPPAVLREARARGDAVFPARPRSPRAQVREIDGPAGPVGLRIVAPASPRGVYLHIHGGGWVNGANDQNDPLLERLADRHGLAAVSVNYRLAPEDPYPAAPDDCEAAALWLVRHAGEAFGADWLAIGGESAGAHLAAVTLLRLRDRHGFTGFRAANLVYGVYDLALTPSVRNWGPRRLVLNTHTITWFRDVFAPDPGSWSDPDLSPIHGDLGGMPPALFTVGTLDPLLDDTLFMQARWAAAGNRSAVALFPGGAHGFSLFGGPLAERFDRTVDEFLAGELSQSSGS